MDAQTAVADDLPIPEHPSTEVAPKFPSTDEETVRLDHRLVSYVSAGLVFIAFLLCACLYLQWHRYDFAITSALSQATPDHAAAIAYSHSLGVLVVRILALMLAFTVVFFGALYVLRTATSGYSLSGSGGGFSANLQTSSPGLVMVTLGLTIVAVAVLAKGDEIYSSPEYATEPAAASTPAPTPVPAVSGLGFEQPSK